MPADAAWAFLRASFGEPWLGLEPACYGELLQRLHDARIGGGAVYDALVAESARRAGATLLSLDRRATTVYELIGVTHRLLA